MKTIPLLEPITFNQAKKISPWPNRILGLDRWQKKVRDEATILAEYNNGWYRAAVRFFTKEKKQKNAYDRCPTGAALLAKNFEKSMNQSVQKMTKVYGGFSNQTYLVSLGSTLCQGNVEILSRMFREYVADVVGAYTKAYQAAAVCELGSGIGINLFTVLAQNPALKIYGGEICPNALTFSKEVSSYFKIKSVFKLFKYRDPNSLANLVPKTGKYILFTVHSIEQLPQLPDFFVSQIRNLPNPPEAVLHFEPIQFPGTSTFTKQCRRYSEINLYNQDLYTVLKKAEQVKEIKILDIQKYCIGISAFNPTSFIAWKPN